MKAGFSLAQVVTLTSDLRVPEDRRDLAIAAGAEKFRVDLITHPKPTQGPDFYNRLDMLWPGRVRR